MNTRMQLESWQHSEARKKLFTWYETYQAESVILIVPPVALLERPSLSVHILQSCAQHISIGVNVFYANIIFGAWISEERNNALCYLSPQYLLSERLFAATAYANPPLGKNGEATFQRMLTDYAMSEADFAFSFAELQQLAQEVDNWVTDIASLIVSKHPQVVGCTTIFEQTAASVAILKAIKKLSPTTITIIGGANCAGDMAEGIASLSPAIDYVFSGESEAAFTDFLEQVNSGKLPTEKVIKSLPCLAMDAIPNLNYQEYYQQLTQLMNSVPSALCIPFESSRGCWWGEKKQCTFCGINNDYLQYRKKSPNRVIAELKELMTYYPATTLMAYDSIMPHSYYTEFLPLLKEVNSQGMEIFYEQKSNINLTQMRQLKDAKVDIIQPGIEALSTSLLKLMCKGVRGSQNIAMMRYARLCGVAINWNLLYGFPSDKREDYEETLRYIALIHHLTPPAMLIPLNIDRFSQYFLAPSKYGIRNLQPLDSYREVLPNHVDPSKICYRFTGEYESGSLANPDIIAALNKEIAVWRAKWVPAEEIYSPRLIRPPVNEEALPTLQVTRLSAEQYRLFDSRGIAGTVASQIISREQAYAALVNMPIKSMNISQATYQWALTHQVALDMDGIHTALATASLELLTEFEQQRKPFEQRPLHIEISEKAA